MKISSKGLDLIKSFEGCSLTAYKALPTEKYYTIGYGHYGPEVKNGAIISKEGAELLLKSDLAKFEDKVNKYGKYNWSQNEFDALVSFAYNIGSIDQLTANGTRTKEQISEKILDYNRSGGVVIAGLTRRRKAEKELFDGGKETFPTLRKGSRGNDVLKLQSILVSKGYPLVMDGIYGQNTERAVISFQALHNDKTGYPLIKDGIVGKKTWEALMG